MNKRIKGEVYNISTMAMPSTSPAQYLAKGVHRVLTSIAAVFALVAVTVCVCVALGRGPATQSADGSQGTSVTYTTQGDSSTPDVPAPDAPLTPDAVPQSGGSVQGGIASASFVASAQVHGTSGVLVASARSSRTRSTTHTTRTAQNGTVTVVTRTTDRSGVSPNVTTHTHSVSRATTVAGAVTVTITDTYRTTS